MGKAPVGQKLDHGGRDAGGHLQVEIVRHHQIDATPVDQVDQGLAQVQQRQGAVGGGTDRMVGRQRRQGRHPARMPALGHEAAEVAHVVLHPAVSLRRAPDQMQNVQAAPSAIEAHTLTAWTVSRTS